MRETEEQLMQMVKVRTGAWQSSYPVYDGHGNMVCSLNINRPALATNSSTGSLTYGGGTNYTTNSVSGAKKYDVWGAVRSGNSTYPNTKYCANLGHIADDELGLIYMRARYYEPGSGRFISQDPARQGSNFFSYCGNELVNRIDPDGKVFIELCLVSYLRSGLFFGTMNLTMNITKHLLDGTAGAISAQSLIYDFCYGFASGFLLPLLSASVAGVAALGGLTGLATVASTFYELTIVASSASLGWSLVTAALVGTVASMVDAAKGNVGRKSSVKAVIGAAIGLNAFGIGIILAGSDD